MTFVRDAAFLNCLEIIKQDFESPPKIWKIKTQNNIKTSFPS